ncbi:MAG: 50S ribosomal protein L3 [Candidatus Omnitrophica bacterium]|nr:50S ribosomal protein L3 [Candidatus Omnitrophota bacterium]
MQALLGKKVGMTQFINKEGALTPATVLEAGPCLVVDVKNVQRHGYKSAQIGFGEVREKALTKALNGQFAKNKLSAKKWLREVRLSPEENYEVGQEIKADIFKPGDLVDVQGRSIGKGFGGGMKRWHWRGGPGSHGSMFHRRIGSAGASSFPSRTWPGHRMPGHLGDRTATVQNLEVLKVDASRNLLLLKGSVPGGDNALLFIRRSLKKPQGVKPKTVQKASEKKDPLKASKQAAAGGGKKK